MSYFFPISATISSPSLPRMEIGDKINVKCKSVSKDERARITWEAVTKYHRTTPYECDLEPSAIVLGRIIDIKNCHHQRAAGSQYELCSVHTQHAELLWGTKYISAQRSPEFLQITQKTPYGDSARRLDIKNFPQSMAVFVRLEDNQELDVLCSMPVDLEIEKGVQVVVRISSVEPLYRSLTRLWSVE